MTAIGGAEPPLCLPPLPLPKRGASIFPAGAIDSHFHVFAPELPLAPTRSYTPQIRTLADWGAYADAFGIARGVVVQPSVYGRDNRALLAGLAAEPERLRGVVVLDPDNSQDELRALHDAGVRGVRFNTLDRAGLPLSAVDHLARKIEPLGWHLQFLLDSTSLPAVASLAVKCPVPIVVDHMGLVQVGDPATRTTSTETLRRLIASAHCYVKISAPYRLGINEPWHEANALVAKLAAENSERLLWGSDWPHTDLYRSMPGDDALNGWARERFSGDLAKRVFVENPMRLYWAN